MTEQSLCIRELTVGDFWQLILRQNFSKKYRTELIRQINTLAPNGVLYLVGWLDINPTPSWDKLIKLCGSLQTAEKFCKKNRHHFMVIDLFFFEEDDSPFDE